MHPLRRTLGVLIATLSSTAPVRAQSAPPSPSAANLAGLHDFDFQVGEWRVHHRIKRADNQPWMELDGTCTNRPVMAGFGNLEEHTFNRPSGITRAVALRAYDPNTGQWAIWWVDGRNPLLPIDPPVIGHFENGVGTFYSEGVYDGNKVRTRFLWSNITATSAHWEQAESYDGGQTWETNWVMEFHRTS